MENLRFSIVMPAYNAEKYIQGSIDSVLEQSFENYELIVVDDCSKDKTFEIIKQYGGKVKALQNNENRRAGGARNTGLNAAKGEYIIFLDSDDKLYEKDTLKKIDDIIGNSNVDLVYLGFKFSGNRNDLVIPSEEECTKKFKAAEDDYMNIWSKCWNREYLNKNNIRFAEGRYYEDTLFNFQGIMKSNSHLVAEFPTHIYQCGIQTSMTNNITFKHLYDVIENLKDMSEIKKTNNTEEINILIEKTVDLCKRIVEKVMGI